MKISAKKVKGSESTKEENQDSQELKNSEENLKNLEAQNLILQEMITLRENSYFRHKLLNLLERQAQALENLNQNVNSLVDLEKEGREEESEEEEVEEEDEEDEE